MSNGPNGECTNQGCDGRNDHASAGLGARAAAERTGDPHALASRRPLHRAADFATFKHIRHSWNDLYELVLDVKSYPAFVPHCRDVRLLSRKSEGPARTIILSRMTVGLALFEVSYANQTVGDATARRIDVESIDGPLRHLHVIWKFAPIADDQTKVEFSVSYEFDNPILAGLASRVFTLMFSEIVNAFERRANQLCRRGRTSLPMGR